MQFPTVHAEHTAKYGVKMLALCGARTCNTSKLEIYARKQPNRPNQVDNSGKTIVKRMIDPISSSGRNVTRQPQTTGSLPSIAVMNVWVKTHSHLQELFEKREIPRALLTRETCQWIVLRLDLGMVVPWVLTKDQRKIMYFDNFYV